MTQKQHDDEMQRLRSEFAVLWRDELAHRLTAPSQQRLTVKDLAWLAFTHGKIPEVDKD